MTGRMRSVVGLTRAIGMPFDSTGSAAAVAALGVDARARGKRWLCRCASFWLGGRKCGLGKRRLVLRSEGWDQEKGGQGGRIMELLLCKTVSSVVEK